ncbi:MAG TPA: hypothetical protein VH062_13840 [Polyangiaceae bacterium]|jgi:hypothetical protein|nr:hypothetical protein [Polyangiaceae bacterium]
MAKDSTTSARDFLLAESARPSSPRLSDWLLEDLKGPRTSSYPPAPLESSVEASSVSEAAAPVAEQEPVAVAPPAEFAVADVPLDDDDGDEEQRESIELAESLSYARASDLPDEPAPPSVPPVSERADTAVYANASDWTDEDDDEATTFFASAPEHDEPIDGIDEPLEEGASLSPQVLTAPDDLNDDEHDDAVLFVPGVSGGGQWKTLAAIAAALLVVFLVMHRFRGTPRQTASASQPVAAATLAGGATPANEALIGAPAPSDETDSASANGKKSRGGGFADGLGRSHATPTDEPSIPGGPHVARYPDLPREILNQLEQVFQADELKHGKSSTDSVERYTR